MNVTVLTLLGLSAAVVVWALWAVRDINPQLYPPVHHADGTSEYRLINAGQDRIERTEDDEHWVLRLPAGLWVKSQDEGRTEAQKRDNPDYPYNLNFDIALGLPDFDFVDSPLSQPGRDVLRVRVSALALPYGTGAFDGQPRYSFSSQFDLHANFNCRMDTQVGEGVYSLRQPSEAEAQQMLETHGANRHFTPPECETTAHAGFEKRLFAVLYGAQKPIGRGYCLAKPEAPSDLEHYENCRFRFWLPLERSMSVSLDSKYIPDLQNIYRQVATLLRDATDTDKSANIADWKVLP